MRCEVLRPHFDHFTLFCHDYPAASRREALGQDVQLLGEFPRLLRTILLRISSHSLFSRQLFFRSSIRADCCLRTTLFFISNIVQHASSNHSFRYLCCLNLMTVFTVLMMAAFNVTQQLSRGTLLMGKRQYRMLRTTGSFNGSFTITK